MKEVMAGEEYKSKSTDLVVVVESVYPNGRGYSIVYRPKYNDWSYGLQTSRGDFLRSYKKVEK